MVQIPATMQSQIRSFLLNCVRKFPELSWDRGTYDPINQILTVYGWLPHSETYKDFLIIDIDCDVNNRDCPLFLSFATSSVKYSSQIHTFFGLKGENHRNCMILHSFLQGQLLPDQ